MSNNILLFKQQRNQVRYWKGSIDTSKEYPELVMEQGILGGKGVEHRRPIRAGKNIGRANETTPVEQAALELESRAKKQLDSGYVSDKRQLEQFYFAPMLAAKISWKDIRYPVVLQPKLNGVRGNVYNEGGTIKIYSRGGKEMFALYEHKALMRELKNLYTQLSEDVILDGEFYTEGMSLQDISGAVKKAQDSTKKLVYHVYDAYYKDNPNLNYKERFLQVKAFLALPNHRAAKTKKSYVKLTDHAFAQNMGEVQAMYDRLVQEGFEGAILRNWRVPYRVDKRTKDLMKYKNFIDEEFLIIGAEQDVHGLCKWICRSHHHRQGDPFPVVPTGTHESRKALWETAHESFGKWLTVRYLELSNDGMPIGNVVGLAVRDYE